VNPIAQTYIAIAIPTLAVLFGILLNRQDITTLRSEMRVEMTAMRTEFKADLHREIGGLRGEIITLRDNIHQDMSGLHERLAVVETQQQR
jgi:hypothetical protein